MARQLVQERVIFVHLFLTLTFDHILFEMFDYVGVNFPDTLDEIKFLLKLELNKLSHWCTKNKLTIN